jgi:hypothetical protein
LFVLDGDDDLSTYLDSDNATFDYDPWFATRTDNYVVGDNGIWTAFQSGAALPAGASRMKVFALWSDGVTFYISHPSDWIEYPA